MPTTKLTDAERAMLTKPNPAVISTIRNDGQPVSAATWYLLRDDHILANIDIGRKCLGHMRKDPRVSLTVLDEASWYDETGRVSAPSSESTVSTGGVSTRTTTRPDDHVDAAIP